MSLLLLGSGGQVGRALQRMLPPHTALDRTALDITDLDALRAAIRQHAPRMLINAAAYTAVDRAEAEPALAHRINAEAVAVMAQEMQLLDGWLVHYSTDYVFAGTGDAPYREDDACAPLNVYGQSKLAGETAIRASGVRHLLLRTSWVYSMDGTNFAKTILKLAREKPSLRVVDDQFGAPTHAALIAEVTARMLEATPPQAGTYHLVADGETSWHGFAHYLLLQAAQHGIPLTCPADRLEAIAASAYPTAARRPHNSRLAHEKIEQAFAIRLPSWQDHAQMFIRDYAEAL